MHLPAKAMRFPLFPDQASRVAAQTDQIYWALIGLSTVMLLIVFGPMIFFLFRYRRGKAANRTPVSLPTTGIELTWTILPALILIGFYIWATQRYFAIERPPRDALNIHVIGKQWMWKVQHPDGAREINELHVPAGRTVKLIMTSEDVIHSFFLPAFRIKQDVLPSRYTTEWFHAEGPGASHLFCSEYCGTDHSRMVGRVVVLSPVEYQDWVHRGHPGDTLSQSGERLFRELGCSGCHLGNSTVRAPPLQGLFGSPVPLSDKTIVIADEGYIRDSILLPAKQIAAGYTNDMPSYQGRINEEELLQIIAYLRSTSGNAGGKLEEVR